jgi:NAD(P)-dependent dehydrogenase (short-subunit alcohol dehydrogenase family)
MELRDKVVVVTGAGRGAGRSIALALAREGARLALASRTESELKAVGEEVKALGAEVIAIPTDLSDPQQIEGMAQETLKTFGTVDVVINNAGWCPALRLVQDTSTEDWDFAMNVNARGAFLVTKAFLPTLLAKRSGHVLNVSSEIAKKGVATAVAYGASKAAMLAFGQGLLAEVAPLGIRVTNVVPGTMNTSQRWDDNPDFPRETVMEPDDLAQVVVSLLKLNDYVLVEEIPVRPILGED